MASGKGVKRHVHMYHYINLGYGLTWACALDCSHFQPVIFEGNKIDRRIIGRKSVCWECRTEFVLDENALTEDQPRCITCREPELSEIINTDKLNEYLKSKEKV